LFFLEHPPVITVGRDFPSCPEAEKAGIEVFAVARGGGYTYHGPGQLVVYPIFDLRRRGRDLRRFVHDIEQGIIAALGQYGLTCGRNPNHTGVWVNQRKIASLGIGISQWVSYHGAAVNLTTDLDQFKAIDPCGLPPETMTSVKKETGREIPLTEFAERLAICYADVFDTDFSDVDLDELVEMIQAEEASQSL
jgi:lipoyl(octanoyl) transferase